MAGYSRNIILSFRCNAGTPLELLELVLPAFWSPPPSLLPAYGVSTPFTPVYAPAAVLCSTRGTK